MNDLRLAEMTSDKTYLLIPLAIVLFNCEYYVIYPVSPANDAYRM